MVRSILSLIDREIRGLHEAAYLLAGFSLLSQVLALLRDRTFAHFFGAGPELDMYFAAFRVPDTVFAILTLCVSSFALIPLFTKRSEEERRGALRALVWYFAVCAIPLTALVALCLPAIMPYLVPGFSAEALRDTTLLARIMLLQPFLLGVSSIVSAYVQSERRFALFALAPIFYNLGIIVGAFFVPAIGVSALAWGVVFGATLHLLVQLVPALRGTRASGTLAIRDLYRQVVLPSVPRSAALMATQVLLIAFAAMASAIAVGSVSAMTFAFNLQSVPLTVIGLSYASALFPALSAHAHRNEWEAYTRELWTTMRHLMFWLLPATMFVIVLRAHIVRVILGSGAFSWDDTRLTAAMLALFTLSLVGQAAILAFSRAYYAAGKTLLPIVLNVSGALAAAAFSYYAVFVATQASVVHYFVDSLLRVDDVPGTLVLLLPLAYSVAMLLTASIFALVFSVEYGFERSCTRSVGASFSASVIGATVTYLALQAFGPVLPTNTFLGIFAQGAVSGSVGLLAWILVLWLLGSTEFTDIASLVRTRLTRHATHS